MTSKFDYKRGKIYKVVNNKNDKFYIGSTITLLSDRMSKHRRNSKGSQSKFYKAVREIGRENFRIELIRNFPCSSRKELIAEEIREIKNHPKEKLYNDFDGKLSEETISKMKISKRKNIKTEEEKKATSAKMSKVRTKRGCIERSGNTAFTFRWVVNGKREFRHFSQGHYGSVEKAKQAAIDFQNERFPVKNITKETKNISPYYNGKIYKIWNTENDIIYVGSTISTLGSKLSSHRNNALFGESKFYIAIKTIGPEKFNISSIRDVQCNNEDELLDEEFKEISKYNASKLYNTTLIRPKGCLYFVSQWFFAWHGKNKNGKLVKKRRKFSVNKYGNTEAKKKAIDLQNEIYPPNSDIVKEKLKKLCFKRGYVGYAEYWIFTWSKNAKSTHRSFSVQKYGKEGAKAKAIALRNKIFPIYSEIENLKNESKDAKSNVDDRKSVKRKYNANNNNDDGDDSDTENSDEDEFTEDENEDKKYYEDEKDENDYEDEKDENDYEDEKDENDYEDEKDENDYEDEKDENDYENGDENSTDYDDPSDNENSNDPSDNEISDSDDAENNKNIETQIAKIKKLKVS